MLCFSQQIESVKNQNIAQHFDFRQEMALISKHILELKCFKVF